MMRSEFTSCCTFESFVSLGMDIVAGGCQGQQNNLLFCHNHNKYTTDYLNKYGLRRWKAAFGVRPIVAYDAWLRVRIKANARGLRTLHLFWCLHWMKTYATEDNISQKLKTSPKTFREKVRLFVKLLAKAMPLVVSTFHLCLVMITTIFIEFSSCLITDFCFLQYQGKVVKSFGSMSKRRKIYRDCGWHGFSNSRAKERRWKERG